MILLIDYLGRADSLTDPLAAFPERWQMQHSPGGGGALLEHRPLPLAAHVRKVIGRVHAPLPFVS